jgi:hypothetical protein
MSPGGGEHSFPRWYHWMIAAMLLAALMLAVPLFAAFL